MRLLVFAACLVLAACGKPAPLAVMAAPVGDSPTRGPADAWVTLVEFSDFECPSCGAAQPTIAQLLALYPTDLRLVFKHFPLSFHADARPAAIAAECARAQGRFWQMHDLLWAGRPLLASNDLAADAGLELGVWQCCLASSEPAARVDADIALGKQMGVRATPTFALNGQPLEGAAPLDDFKQKVESARATAEASGIPRQEYYDRAVLGLHE